MSHISTANGGVRIELIHSRDPDGGCDITVVLDGTVIDKTQVEQVDIDPGYGYSRAEWDATTASMSAAASPAAAALIRRWRDQAADDSPYVDGRYTSHSHDQSGSRMLCVHCATPIASGIAGWFHLEECPEGSACWEGTAGPTPDGAR